MAQKTSNRQAGKVVADPKGYFTSWSAQLLHSAHQVRDLIGAKHWLSDGRHKETLLSNFLREKLPQRFNISSGFVYPVQHPDKISREIDVLVLDGSEMPPVLASGGFGIVSPQSVRAHIHVKSTLTASALRDAIACAISAQNALEAGHTGVKYVASLFFYNLDANLGGQDAVQRLLQNSITSFRSLLAAIAPPHFTLVVLDHYFVVFKPRDGSASAKLQVFEASGLAAALFLADLAEHIIQDAARDHSRLDLMSYLGRSKPKLLYSLTI